MHDSLSLSACVLPGTVLELGHSKVILNFDTEQVTKIF